MKFLKLTLVAILSLFLLTAVLPSTDIDITEEVSNHNVKQSKVKLTAFTEREKGANIPPQG